MSSGRSREPWPLDVITGSSHIELLEANSLCKSSLGAINWTGGLLPNAYMFLIILSALCTTSISWMPPYFCLALAFKLRPSSPLALPLIWHQEQKMNERKTKGRQQTLNTSSSSKIRSSCRDWLLGSTITFCIVPLSRGREHTCHKLWAHTRITDLAAHTHQWKCPECCQYNCFYLTVFAFELCHTQFLLHNQVWQQWEWRPHFCSGRRAMEKVQSSTHVGNKILFVLGLEAVWGEASVTCLLMHGHVD